jgi:FAD/FMN-containing dehydrogenase
MKSDREGKGAALPRRELLAGLSAVAVLGFDPVRRAWAADERAAFDCVPALEGELVVDPAALESVSTDVGNIIRHTPVAVLRPRSARDVSAMVQFCRQRRIQIAARGQGHTNFGQSLVEGGLVIEMRTLSAIHAIGADFADVGTGLLWNELLAAASAVGLTPPVFTGYTALSIGGTLSVGGIPARYRRGIQVEYVRALEVVTGEGEIVECSAEQRRDLFEAVLAGLGQCGIMTRAVVALEPVPESARVFLLTYDANAQFFADLRMLMDRAEFDELYNLWLPDGSGGWLYQLNAVKYFNADAPPHDAALLRDLSIDPAAISVSDAPFVDYVLRVDALIELFRQSGLWDGVLHPWFDVILPDDAVEDYVGEVVPSLAPDDVGQTGFLLLFPLRRSQLTRPAFRIPEGDDEWVWLFDILTASALPGPDPAFVERMLARNRSLFEKARELGATRYPIGALRFSRRDWIRQYGSYWSEFRRAKHRFDPAKILTPGPGIF